MRPLVVNGRPGAAVFIHPDLRALGPDIADRGAGDPLWRDTIVYLTRGTRTRSRDRVDAHRQLPRHHVLVPVWWGLRRYFHRTGVN